jgi:hypothetical protein
MDGRDSRHMGGGGLVVCYVVDGVDGVVGGYDLKQCTRLDQ